MGIRSRNVVNFIETNRGSFMNENHIVLLWSYYFESNWIARFLFVIMVCLCYYTQKRTKVEGITTLRFRYKMYLIHRSLTLI